MRFVEANRARLRLVGLAMLVALWPQTLLMAAEKDDSLNYLVGRSRTDVTGPVVGVQMLGFVRPDQITEGIHLRQYCRSFVIVDPETDHRLALSVVDMLSVTHELWQEVLDRLHDKYGDLYRRDNFVLTATHTHSGPGGFWHYTANTPVGAPFYGEFFDALADSIVDSVVQAHEDLRPAKILVARGSVANASAQRSKPAYMNNPEEERSRYEDDVDREMTLLKFVDANGPIGAIDYFAVHPTTMTFYNHLISSDNKGVAAIGLEEHYGGEMPEGEVFVAAFPNSNCGDVTGNLNLDNTGPGEDEFETTQIIGQRQLDEAIKLFDTAKERVVGPIKTRQQFVDFSSLEVDGEFTSQGSQTTSPAAFGYAFAAGSTEDGGGHPLFREGMTRSSRLLDNIARSLMHAAPLSHSMRDAHRPKAILFAPGEMTPPAYAQVLSLGVAQLGQLAFVYGPAEFTTMTGRRIREQVAEALDLPARDVIIAGFSNGYSGYVTTNEEYQTQQYEGGHTLFGPWTEAGYRQQYTRMAQAIAAGEQVGAGPAPREMRGTIEAATLGTSHDLPPEAAEFGDVAQDTDDKYTGGNVVQVAFWTGNPLNYSPSGGSFLSVEKQDGDQWVEVADDGSWSTRCRWTQPSDEAPSEAEKPAAKKKSPLPDKSSLAKPANLDAYQVWIEWTVPSDAPAGTYRIVHHGAFKPEGASEPTAFDAASKSFTVE